MRIIGGERSGPPENVGGNFGYHNLLLYLQTSEFTEDILSFVEEYAQRISHNNGYCAGVPQLSYKLQTSKYFKKMNDIYNALNYYIDIRVSKDPWFRSEYFDIAKTHKRKRRAFRSTLSAMNAPSMKYPNVQEMLKRAEPQEGTS